MSDLKKGSKIEFTKEFVDYFVIQSFCGNAVVPIQPGTQGKVKQVNENDIIIVLKDPKNPLTIAARRRKKDKKIDFFKIIK